MNSNRIFINKELDLDILRTVIKRYWLLISVIFLLSFLGAFIYLRYTKAIYQSDMLIQISKEDTGKEVINFENINNNDNISAEIELLRSQFLFEKAISSLSMNVSHYSKGSILTEEKYLQSSFNVTPFSLNDSSLCNVPIFLRADESNKRNITLEFSLKGKDYKINGKLNERIKHNLFDISIKTANFETFKYDISKNELYFTFNSSETLTNKYLPGLTITPIDFKAKTIQISYKSNNAILSKDITSAVGNAFFDYDDDIQKESAEKILEFISNQLDSLSIEVKSSRDSITDYQRKENIPDPESYSTSLNTNISKLQDILFELEEEKYTLKLIESKIQSNTNRLEIYKLLPVLYNKSFESTLGKQIEALLAKLERKEDLLFEVTEQNSSIQELNGQIKNNISIINRSVNAISERIEDKRKVIISQISNSEKQYFELPEKKIELNRLKNLQSLNEKYYTMLTEKKVLYSISNAGYTSLNKTLSKAYLPKTPISPKKIKIYTGFGFFGLLVGFVFLFYKYVSYNEINSLEDLRKILPENARILGAIPFYKNALQYSQLIVEEAPKSMIAEAMRNIRSNLTFIDPDAKLIAISSSISGEGKTFVALNLAGIIAMSGKKTIIIDLDLRKPKIHLGLNEDNQKGISNILSGSYTYKECVKNTSLKNLDIITAGPLPPNPSELILSKKFDDLIAKLKEEYDTVIIDNPPVGLVSDGIKTLSQANIPIYIFKANYSKRQFVERVKELKEIQKIDKLNVILNGLKVGKGRYGYGYNGYYEDIIPQKKSIFTRILDNGNKRRKN